MAKMVKTFARVVDYRNYRLPNKRSKLTATEATEVYNCK